MASRRSVPSEVSDDPQDQGRRLYDAISALTSELSLDAVLQNIADLSRELVGASYSALGVVGENDTLVQFITSGISKRGRERIGRIPEGKGVLGVVLRMGKPLRLADLNQHPEAVGLPQNHPMMKSFLGVPISYKGHLLGNLYLTNKIGAEQFSQGDETLVTLFATQAAVAIENARLFETEYRRSAQLDFLNRAGRELTRIFDLDQLLQRVAELLQEGFGYQNVQVYWVDQDNSTLQLRALAGLVHDRVLLGIDRTWEEGVAGRAASSGQPVMCNEVSQDPEHAALDSGLEASAELAVPVIVKAEVVAVIHVDGMDPYAFDDSDMKTVGTLSDQLANAIENIQLYRQQQEQSRRLAVVEERDRIGRDLHDGVIQSMYAVGLTLEDISSRADKEPSEVRPRIDEVVGDLNRAIGDIRSYIMDLRPRELQGRNPDEALQSLAQYLEDRTGVSVGLDVGIDLASLSERYIVNIWHIFQEAFSNIEKYAGAKRVTVSLAVSDGSLILDIADDGQGFDLEKAELGRGYGLPNIKDRAERLGGALLIESSPGKGTRLNIRIPVN
ncbi:MAG: GAF domain-containing sensor histidine kinase [Chloroflexi bacterium]|nr:GAF domain-containing sensor histidine kinase [Chloroflexota bacterium]